ncbi:GNAT family N-acetyltransferase [Streptomyces sp. NPDC090054]|uniref:GNAT family N-acetyltransferase n=1 Tax=Streptomyces sp. NPDC090054 TaxID=3365933 RepID=UPI003806D1C0
MPTDNSPSPLDNPVWAALTGTHRRFAQFAGADSSGAGDPSGAPGPAGGLAARYLPDANPFSALSDPDDPRSWAALAELAGPGEVVWLTGLPTPPPGWETVASIPGVQLDGRAVAAESAPEAVRLGPADVPEMLELVRLTEPGPFLPRTVELGTYLGIRHEGRLVAMAGERLRPPGWAEISAVCTHPEHRGGGLAGRLVRAVAAVVRERGDSPFLHAAAANTGAVRLYRSMGFVLRREPVFIGVRTPGSPGPLDPETKA